MGCLSKNRARDGYKLPPKTVVLREEFVALTKEPLVAIVLGQLLYWTQRVKDFDLFLKEEGFFNPDCKAVLRHGWIYKTANDLIEETMICVDRTTMRRYLKTLMDRGWLEERSHPTHRWDKTSQYRLNLRKLQEDLLPLGFELPGINVLLQQEFIHKSDDEEDDSEELDDEELISDLSKMAEISKGGFAPSKEQNISCLKKSAENSRVQNAPSNGYTSPSKEEIDPSNVTNSPLYIQRLQSENINREHSQDACARETGLKKNFSDFENLENSTRENSSTRDIVLDNFTPDETIPCVPGPDESIPSKSVPGEPVPDVSIAEEMVRLWEYHVVQKLDPANWRGVLHVTSTRQDQLESLFAFHFQNDIRLWEQFCLRVKTSSFLMGGGPNGWKVTLDWILNHNNLLKILEGNYDDSHGIEQEPIHEWSLSKIQLNPIHIAQKDAILASIKDPIWREWCTRLSQGVRLNELQMSHVPLSLVELSQIANARFIECEDEQLVWVGSPDQAVLNAIENMRLKINWVFAKEYPKARTIRTRLLEKKFPLSQNGNKPLSLPAEPTQLPTNPIQLLTNPTPSQGDHRHA